MLCYPLSHYFLLSSKISKHQEQHKYWRILHLQHCSNFFLQMINKGLSPHLTGKKNEAIYMSLKNNIEKYFNSISVFFFTESFHFLVVGGKKKKKNQNWFSCSVRIFNKYSSTEMKADSSTLCNSLSKMIMNICKAFC